jgi:hypothetical protein
MDVHITAAQPGDAVLVTSEAVLAAILDEGLPISAALDRGMVAVGGELAAADAVRRSLALTLDSRAPTPSGEVHRRDRSLGHLVSPASYRGSEVRLGRQTRA